MENGLKKRIVLLISTLCIAIISAFGFYSTNQDKPSEKIVETAINFLIDKYDNTKQAIITKEVSEEATRTKEAIKKGENLSTVKVISKQEADENKVTDEGAIEQDAVVEQENISYDGTNTGNGLSLLGAYQGLTYYSQVDSRWKNTPYTSVGDSSQTIGSSGCGPTSAAMVVSSSKGTILPTTMANLFVSNGYRTANNGTAWSAFSFVADYFDFEKYHTTSNFNTATNYLKTDDDHDGNSDYYIICSCGSGLFTTGGHYIVLVADNSGTITVYDPYLYDGKFDTASRRAANVKVSGNSVYVSENSFKKYANAQNYWVYSNDKGKDNPNKNNQPSTNKYTRYVSTQSLPLNVRANPNGAIIGSLPKGTAVTVSYESNGWARITSPMSGYVSTTYLSSSPVNNSSSSSKTITGYRTGTYKVNNASVLNVRTGPSTSYRTKTYNQLTSNARSQNKSLGNYYTNGYKRGVVCTVTKVSGNWGLTASGWICLDYCTLR